MNLSENNQTSPDANNTNADKALNQSFVESRTLKGFRDLLPADALVKNQMTTILASVFESFGFVPIQTPHLERAEALFGDAGAAIQKQVYKFTDNGGREVALRFDLTVPFARYISEHMHEVGLPFKRWAIGNVFRGENTQAGRYREFTQCDFDFVGTTSLCADAEVVQVINASLLALGVDRFQIRINSRKIMDGLVSGLGIPDKTADVLQEIDKFDKVGADAVRDALISEHGIEPSVAQQLIDFVRISEQDLSPADLFKKTETFRGMHPKLDQGLDDLQALNTMLSAVGIEYPRYRIDLSIARGLGYYTGIVYETILLDLPSIGSVCSGGRYDNLTQTFRKEPCPGVGASVGIDRLIAGLEELGLVPKVGTPADVLVLMPQDDSLVINALQIGKELRAAGLRAEVYPEGKKFKNQFQYARRAGHPFVVSIKNDGNFTVENMSSGVQTDVTCTKDLIEACK